MTNHSHIEKDSKGNGIPIRILLFFIENFNPINSSITGDEDTMLMSNSKSNFNIIQR